MKRLKDNFEMLSLINAIKKSKEDVYLTTADGDHMNLKSSLCQYVFAFAIASDSAKDILKHATIECTCEEDYALLSDYLTEL